MAKKSFIYFTAVVALLCPGSGVLAQSIQTAVTVTVVPNAPSNLVAIPLAPTQVEVTWTNNAMGPDWVSVERKTGVSGTYAEVTTTTGDIAMYVDDTVLPSTTYFYRVRASESGIYSLYSNEGSVTTPAAPIPPSPPSGGGGGGGGGGFSPPSAATTNVTISGSAYPSSRVFILQDGQIALQTVAGPDANFTATIGGLSAGNYDFSVYSQDSAGRRSTAFTFPVTITAGATTLISGVFLSPTIAVDKSEVKQGDTLVIFGQSAPSSTIMIQVNSTQTVLAHTTSTASGAYLYDLDTSDLDMGSHSTKSKAQAGSVISQDSVSAGFTVGTQNVSEQPTTTCPPNYPIGDLNQDCHVNLVDFSILSYWYGKSNPPVAYRLDNKTTIDLTDFSIMAYYWTG